jgi:rubrerythrin
MSEKELFDIFTNAIAAEQGAQKIYRHASALAPTGSPLAEMFRHMADDERGHEAKLQDAYAEFKAAWKGELSAHVVAG